MRSRLLLSDEWTFYDEPWGIGLEAIFRSFVVDAKFGLLLSSSGLFKEFETRQRKKIWHKLESSAGKTTKVGVKIRPIQHFPELWYMVLKQHIDELYNKVCPVRLAKVC